MDLLIALLLILLLILGLGWWTAHDDLATRSRACWWD